MSVLMLLARIGTRGRRAALAGLAAMLAVGLGIGIAALTVSWHTDHAYAEYLRDADVAEVVVNPSLRTRRAEEIIRSTPGVEAVRSDLLMVATADDDGPRTITEIDDELGLQVRVSTDGRYVDQDRPVVHEGRMVDDGAEVFLSKQVAEALGLGVGDTLPLSFWNAGAAETGSHPIDEPLAPLGVEYVEVVGTGVFADGVLPDGLYPRSTAVVTPDVARPYLCSPGSGRISGSPTLEEVAAHIYPEGCAVSYAYFSLRVEAGDDGVPAVLSSIESRLSAETRRLPRAVRAQDAQYYLVPTVTADERERIERSLDPSVTALRLFGTASVVVTLALAVLAMIRLTRPLRPRAQGWRHLGATPYQRVAAIALPLVGCALAGIALGALAGWLASGVGPVASARAVDPNPHLTLPWQPALPAVAASLVVLTVGALGAAGLAARADQPVPRRRTSQVTRAVTHSRHVPLMLGVRAAVRGAGEVALLAAMVGAVAAVLAAAVFSTNLGDVVEEPVRYGWAYDAAAITGAGYGDADLRGVAVTLDRPEVTAWGVAALGAATVDGEAVPFVAGRAGFDDLPITVVDGHAPAGENQLAVGATTADRLDIDVGDEVTVTTSYGPHTGTVTGLVVLPPVGPMLTDRAGLGTGMVLPAPFLEKALAGAESAGGLEPRTLADQLGSFIVLDLAEDVDPREFMEAIGDLGRWDAHGYAPFVYTEPVRPAQIADLAETRSAPMLLASLVAAATALGLGLAVGLAVRTRYRELALLAALGATGRQLRSTLRWQALTIAGTGLVFGVPLGVALGSTAWRSFADDLGIVPDPTVSLVRTALIVAAGLVVGLAAAVMPGYVASRISPAVVLRNE